MGAGVVVLVDAAVVLVDAAVVVLVVAAVVVVGAAVVVVVVVVVIGVQTPLSQYSSIGHRTPHAPQLFTSVVSSTHTPLQIDWPSAQLTHASVPTNCTGEPSLIHSTIWKLPCTLGIVGLVHTCSPVESAGCGVKSLFVVSDHAKPENSESFCGGIVRHSALTPGFEVVFRRSTKMLVSPAGMIDVVTFATTEPQHTPSTRIELYLGSVT